MLHRIVRLNLREDATDEFLRIYEEVGPRIRSFPGCRHVELWVNREDPLRLATYSVWDGPEALEGYRTSDQFLQTWSRVRLLLADRASAESYVALEPGKSIT
jgi:heme-degrading monooxygenase HmoA